jgi:hypothetical protein
LIRATLIQLDDDDHALVLVIDHIIADGWSADLLARELSVAYREAIGEAAALPAEIHQYPDWVAHEWETFTEEYLTTREAFWRDRFPVGPTDVAVWLPGYRGRADSSRRLVEVIKGDLGETTTIGLREAASRLHVTLYVLTASVLVRLLRNETGQERVTLSTSSASRFSPQTASMIGYLATTIWVSTTIAAGDDLRATTEAFRSSLLEVITMADVPARAVFERLWGRNARALMSAVPQVDFLCSPFWGDSLQLPGLDIEASEFEDCSADGALSVFLTDYGSRIEVQVRSVAGEFEEGYPRTLLDRYLSDLTALAGASGEPDARGSSVGC